MDINATICDSLTIISATLIPEINEIYKWTGNDKVGLPTATHSTGPISKDGICKCNITGRSGAQVRNLSRYLTNICVILDRSFHV
jgi:hypothetical protein